MQALKEDKKYFFSVKNYEFVINKDHEYFHQVQGELYIANRNTAYVVVWTTKDCISFVVEKDAGWPKNISILQDFYVKHFVPWILENPQ